MQDDPLTFTNEYSAAVSSGAAAWQILIVDDDRDIHQATRLALHNVVIFDRPLVFKDAFSGSEAQAMVEQDDAIDLILLDVVMETETAGFDCARYIRRTLNKNPPVIVIRTGFGGHEFERSPAALKAGLIDNFIKKSMTTRELLISVLTKTLRHLAH